jgi:hypothetical protein
MDFDFISKKYPSNDATDGNKLYKSLGSFWTQIFQEKGTLKGYTLGMAEELIQSYYSLIEVLNSYSIKDIPIFNLKRWQPITIKKSEFNQVPLNFQKNSAVFGSQPESDRFYAGKVFRFGFPKNTNNNVFSYKPKIKLKKFNLIANRIISPSLFYINGVDVIIDEFDVLYFNKNIFESSDVPKAAIVGEFGEPIKFKNANGELIEDEFIILWVYHAELDNANLYDNFGRIFELNLASSQSYKNILKGIINLFVSGPTINAIKSIMGAFGGVVPVIEPEEHVEQIYSDNLNKYVITNKNVYTFKPYQNLLKHVVVGAKVYGGELLVDLVQYYDFLISPQWWQKEISTPRLALSSHIFLGNYRHQLFLPNGVDLVTLTTQDKIVFPVQGRPEDVREFHKHINKPENKEELKEKLGLSPDSPSVVINPIDFVFTNILKNNTALLKFNFNDPEELAYFFNFLPLIKDYLPPHVYLLFYINLNLPVDVLDNLNERYSLRDFPNIPLSIDGSLGNGMRPQLAVDDSAAYYKDYINRLFCISEGPYAENAANGGLVPASAQNKEPLHKEQNLLKVTMMTEGQGTAIPGQARVISGKVFTSIPETPVPTTREIPTVLLIDFS